MLTRIKRFMAEELRSQYSTLSIELPYLNWGREIVMHADTKPSNWKVVFTRLDKEDDKLKATFTLKINNAKPIMFTLPGTSSGHTVYWSPENIEIVELSENSGDSDQ